MAPLADLVASAAVIAMLDILRHAAELFGWTLDGEAVSKAPRPGVSMRPLLSSISPTGGFQKGQVTAEVIRIVKP
jgi:hypothetical protein